ncbi:MAG: hypothetical protein LBG78_05600 [Azoarcus sp.]|jgi:hypothetical protein|nr:hypothetical protein [Azoarcus sp.]
MKKIILQFSVPFFLVGCPIDYAETLADYELTITLRDGIPCFLFDAEGVSNEQISISSVQVMESGYFGKEGLAWGQLWEERKNLNKNECLPYGGTKELKMSTLYLAGFYVEKRSQKKGRGYGYDAFFCLTKNQDGQTVLHQWPTREAPAACPAN